MNVLSFEPLLLDVPTVLQGPHTTVRPYEPQDAPNILEAVNESRVDLEARLRSKKDFDSLDDARRLVVHSRGRWILREDFVAGVFDATSGAYCGGVSLHPITWEYGKFEIGYWLRVAARHKGYATEAVRLMSQFAFAHLGAQRVEILVEPDNERSCLVAERAGYVLEGRLRRHLPAPDDTLKDTNVYSLIREDYDLWVAP